MAKKSSENVRRVKMMVCIIGREDEAALTEICNEQCVSLHFSAIAFGTAKSNYLSYLGLDEIEKRVVYSLIPDYCEERLLRAINKRLRLYLPGKGIAFTIPLATVSSIISNAVLSTPYKEESTSGTESQSSKKGKKIMHELIIAVVNQKFSDKVLDCARAAGATGATILHTRSVNNAKAEQLIGTTVMQETDTIAFISSREYKGKIMEAIRENAGLKTDGGAVLFSLPVDSLTGIGRFSEDSEAEPETL